MFSRNVLTSCRSQKKAHWCRSLASAAATDSSTSASVSAPAVVPKRKDARSNLRTAIILNRSPIITRTPTDFEAAYYAYQARIQRALHNPLPYEFYFKPGSILETRFKEEEREREKLAFGAPFGAEEQSIVETDEQAPPEVEEYQEEEQEEPQPRIHPADIKGDVQSLDRQGQRNLYLLLKESGKEAWRFPEGGVEHQEYLHQAAERDLIAECGSFMDSWIVSKNPIGMHKASSTPSSTSSSAPSPVTFFFKAHILSGQVRVDGKQVADFAWLTKEEIESRVDQTYWLAVKDMLSDF
ncbi:hypothetical protein PLICRDRAFT_138985 [Plicaturopsis crispa FD-325 SS-3]|nr:hypothetical protein PLICRDRAFT_138985 [Plicaturopsis crispa FD-325 SS-3]